MAYEAYHLAHGGRFRASATGLRDRGSPSPVLAVAAAVCFQRAIVLGDPLCRAVDLAVPVFYRRQRRARK